MRKPSNKLAQEIANASRVTDSEFVQGARDTRELLATARTLARLQTRRAKLRRELKRIDRAIRHEQKTLRAIAGAIK